jgi:ATP-dependent Clp endopeptidase proteolytic subunit ClpP
MDFIYTQNPDSDEPILLIDGHIGFDSEDGQGVDGGQVLRELLFLDTLEKKRIQVWINSPGGVVMDGYEIFTGITKTKTKVDTYNMGMAASIAAVIFQAGRKRVMADRAILMFHNPYGGDNPKGLDAMRKSLLTMISSRASMTEEDVEKMMNRTSWILAEEAKSMGLCDEVEDTGEQNKPRLTYNYKDFSKIINKQLKPERSMKNVANKLGLVSDASEESIIAAVSVLEAKNKASMEEMDAMKKALDAKKLECDEMEAKYNALKESSDKHEAEAKAKAELEVKAKATELIKNAIATGRIKNESAIVEKYTNLAMNSFDVAKDLIEAIPASKEAPKTIEQTQNTITGSGSVVSQTLAEIRNKLNFN